MQKPVSGIVGIIVFSALLVLPSRSPAMDLTAAAVETAPSVDGVGDESVWSKAEGVTVKDKRAGDEVSLKAVTTGGTIYFLVTFPDAEENALHKPWVWSKESESYELGPQREDGFTFKWSMSGNSVDLSNFADNDYKADVWYWKASRTNPSGYADDKHHILSSAKGKKAKELTGKDGGTRYLMRVGDKGAGAQEKQIVTDYKEDIVPQYVPRKPDGSRADVRAKGLWKDGVWTIEFARSLDTANEDDIPFAAGKGNRYLFAISIFGLYGDDINDGKAHFYGQGRVSDPLTLVIP